MDNIEARIFRNYNKLDLRKSFILMFLISILVHFLLLYIIFSLKPYSPEKIHIKKPESIKGFLVSSDEIFGVKKKRIPLPAPEYVPREEIAKPHKTISVKKKGASDELLMKKALADIKKKSKKKKKYGKQRQDKRSKPRRNNFPLVKKGKADGRASLRYVKSHEFQNMYTEYGAIINETIRENVIFPNKEVLREILKNTPNASVSMRIRVDRNGRILSIGNLLESSGLTSFDNAFINAVKNASPLNVFPNQKFMREFSKYEIELSLSVEEAYKSLKDQY